MGLGAIGGLIGQARSQGARDSADQLQSQAFDEIMNIGLPPDLSKEVLIQKYRAAGKLTPELENAITQASSQVAEMKENSDGRDAQVQALRAMQQVGSGGLRAEDRAAFNKLRNQVAQDTEAKRQQILQQAQMRGQGSSASTIADQMIAAQAEANRASEQGDAISAESSRRALEAIANSGNMGSQLRSADYESALNKSKAQDELNRFNTQNQISLQNRNVDRKNVAQAGNLDNEQRILDTNIGQSNKELYRQNDAKKQYYDDTVQRAANRSNALSGRASQFTGAADRQAAQFQQGGQALQGAINSAFTGGMGGGLGGLGSSFSNLFSRSNQVPQISDSDKMEGALQAGLSRRVARGL